MVDIASVADPLAVAANTVTNVSLERVEADNATVGTTYEMLSNIDATPTFIDIVGTTAGLGIEADCASTKDDGAPAGVGAQEIKIYGLDANWAIQTDTITLDGTTSTTATTNKYAFVNKAEVTAAGSELDAAGVITIQSTAGTLGKIDAAQWRMQNCVWQVPAGHTGYVHGFWYYVLPLAAPVGQCVFRLAVHHYGVMGDVSSNIQYTNICEVTVDEGDSGVAVNEARGGYGTGYFQFPGNVPIVIPGKDIVTLQAKAMSTAVAVSGGFNIMIQGTGAGTVTTDS